MSEVVARSIDGPTIMCAFETWHCSQHAALAGGFDQHHPWPVEMGGAEEQPRLTICALHHRRQHALIRAYVEHGVGARTVKWFSPLERETAAYAVTQWKSVGSPHVYWNVPAAAVVLM